VVEMRLIERKVSVFLGFPGKKKIENANQRTNYTPADNEVKSKTPRNPPFWDICDINTANTGIRRRKRFLEAPFCTFRSSFTISLVEMPKSR
jgi:hypothetical protein